jgi:ABC-type sugar transport system ATPase subunit
MPRTGLYGLCLNLGVRRTFRSCLSKLKGLLFNTASERRSVTRVVESTGLRRRAGAAVKYLSGGNKQKVVFGKWISA